MNNKEPCGFCEALEPGEYRKFVPGRWGELIQAADKNGRPYLYGAGDEESENFFPRFCPCCGKNLDAIFPAPECEGEWDHRGYTRDYGQRFE